MKLFLLALLGPLAAQANTSDLDRGQAAIRSMAGCYLVDFSYTETESLKEGYQRDSRVYDVNKEKSIKEWITVEQDSPTRLRVQHVLFATGLDGKVVEGTVMKHTGDEWEFNAPFRYEFTGPNRWEPASDTAGLWTRRITNLDDGLRYSCAGAWSEETFPTWGCSNYAPIPGRETRDMGRKDYNTLERSTKLVAYGHSWLERQENTKVIDENGARTPLAKELGKNWYVRLPDSDCAAAQEFAAPRKDFWSLTREAWHEAFASRETFTEQPTRPGTPSRYIKFLELEYLYQNQNLRDGAIRAEAKKALLDLIESFRVR